MSSITAGPSTLGPRSHKLRGYVVPVVRPVPPRPIVTGGEAW